MAATVTSAESLPFFVALIAFSLWFALSIVRQFRPQLFDDPFGIVPMWTFFAPNPGRHDYHILYREVSQNDECASPWMEAFTQVKRDWRGVLWNPNKRGLKVLMDCTQTILRLHGEARNVQQSVAYLAVLNVVMSRAATLASADGREFVLVATENSGSSAPLLLFHSEVHSI